jgi:hypothetical protein
MGEVIESGGANIPRRELTRGLAFVGVLLVVVAGLLLWLFSALSACGCTTPPAMEVVNLAASDARIDWQTAGFLGTPLLGSSGSEPIPACQMHAPPLKPGAAHAVTIVTDAARRSFSLVAPTQDDQAAIVWVVIRSDGSIDQVAAAEAPGSPGCGR